MTTKTQLYKLNPKETTVYTIIEQLENKTLLQRHTDNPSSDPTPYIIANGLSIRQNNIIEWDSGNYCRNLKIATNVLFDTTEQKLFPPHEKSIVNKEYEPTKNKTSTIDNQHSNKIKEVSRDNSFTANISMD